jgi:tetratricopeptide (TPR) repeat protein
MGRRVDWPALGVAAALAAAAIWAYGGTFSVPLFYDDVPTIVDNPSIRHLGTAFLPPADTTAGGRPILNLSLALNYAAGGTAVWGYHAVNLAIHVLAGLTLFGIVRRTIARMPGLPATSVAFCAALLWTLHPLETESVTYVIQRAESLMGLFYLLTLYCMIRGAASEGPVRRRWYVLCIAACLLGMGAKEVMVSAPLIALLYDRTFLSGSFGGALRRRRWLYAGLAATWLVLPFLVVSTGARGGTAGFGTGVSWWSYGLTQLPAIVHYLRLCFWPHPLVFDYGSELAPASARLIPSALVVAGLLAATGWAMARKPAIGFLGASFFAILAPSSSFVPVVTETMAEHRMYLPLAAVVVLAVIGIHKCLHRAALPLCLVLAAGLCWCTWQRNNTYRSEVQIWSATAADLPGNARAQNNLGRFLAAEPGRLGEATSRFQEAVRLQPGYAEAHYNLGNALSKVPGRLNDAIAQYREALRLRPDYPEACNNLGNALAAQGRVSEAIAQFEEALRLSPNDATSHLNLADALLKTPGRAQEALAQYEEALRLRPEHAETRYGLGNALIALGRKQEAIAQYEEALRLDPGHVEARYNLANALSAVGRTADAVRQYEEALRLRPGYVDARYNLGIAMDSLGRTQDAIAQYEEALRLKPDFVEVHNNLGCDLEKMPGRLDDAVAQYGEALRLDPGDVEAHNNLGGALRKIPGRTEEAVAQYEEALHLKPDYAEAHYNLGNALGFLGRTPEAVAQYEEAVQLVPGYVAARCNLGIALKSLGRIPEAIAQYEEALRLSPNDVLVHLNLAVALLKTPGRTAEAVAHLREVLRLQPGNPVAGEILAQVGQLP